MHRHDHYRPQTLSARGESIFHEFLAQQAQPAKFTTAVGSSLVEVNTLNTAAGARLQHPFGERQAADNEVGDSKAGDDAC